MLEATMFHYPYDEHPRYTVEALGVPTSYYVAGEPNEQPIVLLHGMSTAADSFREIMHELADTYYLIAPDIPGFGYSENIRPYTIPHLIEWLAAFIEAVKVSPVALLGHSFGGVLAPAYAAGYPEQVTRMLLLAPAILTSTSYPQLLKRVGIALGLVDLGSKISQSRLMVKRQIRVPFYNADAQDESVWERRLMDYAQARASASVMKATAFYDLRPLLDQVKHPVSIVWGQNDSVVPNAHADRLAELLPDAEVHKLPRCGHLPMLEQPGPFLEISRSFFG
jgi:pimeloyl-ACP methyl ester carboxylesterase